MGYVSWRPWSTCLKIYCNDSQFGRLPVRFNGLELMCTNMSTYQLAQPLTIACYIMVRTTQQNSERPHFCPLIGSVPSWMMQLEKVSSGGLYIYIYIPLLFLYSIYDIICIYMYSFQVIIFFILRRCIKIKKIIW